MSVFNTRAWFQKYVPLIKKNEDSAGETANENMDLVTNSIPLLQGGDNFLASTDIEHGKMDDWLEYGNDFEWISSDSDSDSGDDIKQLEQNEHEQTISYQNFKSIPTDHSTDKKLLRCCNDSTGY